jgi:hypothetical protein
MEWVYAGIILPIIGIVLGIIGTYSLRHIKHEEAAQTSGTMGIGQQTSIKLAPGTGIIQITTETSEE